MGNIKDYLVYFWKGTDKLLLFLCLLASSAGVLMVTSATWHTMKEGALLPRDSIALIAAVLIGLAIAMVISLIDIDIFAKSFREELVHMGFVGHHTDGHRPPVR